MREESDQAHEESASRTTLPVAPTDSRTVARLARMSAPAAGRAHRYPDTRTDSVTFRFKTLTSPAGN